MKKTTFIPKISLSIFLLWGILTGSCKKAESVEPPKAETCRPSIVVSTDLTPGGAMNSDTLRYDYCDKDGDGLTDAEEPICQIYTDPSEYTEYVWTDFMVVAKRWVSGSLYSTTVYELDEHGRAVKETRSLTQGPTMTTERTYDIDGHIALISSYIDVLNQTVGTCEWENGNLKRVVYESANGTSISEYEYYPDLANNHSTSYLPIFGKESDLLVKRIVSPNNSTTNFTYTLNNQGYVTKQIVQYDSPGISRTTEWAYFYPCF